MDLTKDIQPVTNLKRNASAMLKQIETTGSPVILTKNGEPRAVIMDVAAYQELMVMKERMATVLVVKQGLEDVQAGRLIPFDDAVKRLKKKYGL